MLCTKNKTNEKHNPHARISSMEKIDLTIHKVIIKQIHQSLKAIIPLQEWELHYLNYYEGLGQGPNIICYPAEDELARSMLLKTKSNSSKPRTDLNITLEEGEIVIKKWDSLEHEYITIATVDLHDTDYLPKTIKHIKQGMAQITKEYQDAQAISSLEKL